ncbi:hypothetical protein Tco_1362299 [Tanacetum coccineum]
MVGENSGWLVSADRLWEHIPTVGLMVVENKCCGERWIDTHLMDWLRIVEIEDEHEVDQLGRVQSLNQFNSVDKIFSIHQEDVLRTWCSLETAQRHHVNVPYHLSNQSETSSNTHAASLLSSLGEMMLIALMSNHA